MNRRIGRFRVSPVFFVHLGPDEGVNLFHRMVVLRTQEHFLSHDREYLAIHPDFRVVAEGEQFPEYRAVFDTTSPYPTWVEVEVEE